MQNLNAAVNFWQVLYNKTKEKIMNLNNLMTGAVLIAAFATSAIAEDRTIRMATEGAYKPYNFINDNGEIDGFEKHLGDELCKRANLKCTWQTEAWDPIIPNLVSGNYDTIIAGMSITAERDEIIDFTQEYFPADPSTYVALAGASNDAINGVVAAQTSTIQAAYAAGTNATVVEFATPEETIAAVRNGEADAVLADAAYLADFVSSSNGDLIYVGDPVAIGGGIGMGIRESDTDLKATMNTAIASMKADGSLAKLIFEWFVGRVVKY